jgi:hypothetical protein
VIGSIRLGDFGHQRIEMLFAGRVHSALVPQARCKLKKVFWFFSSEKNCFPCLIAPADSSPPLSRHR